MLPFIGTRAIKSREGDDWGKITADNTHKMV